MGKVERRVCLDVFLFGDLYPCFCALVEKDTVHSTYILMFTVLSLASAGFRRFWTVLHIESSRLSAAAPALYEDRIHLS